MPVVRRHGLKRILILAAAAGGVPPMYPVVGVPSAFAEEIKQEIKQQFAGTPGEELPLRLELPAQASQDEAGNAGFIRILGLPPSFSLNRGFAAVGAWAVPLNDAGGLVLTAPAYFQGTLLLTVELVRENAEPLRWQVQIALAQKGARPVQPPASMDGMTGMPADSPIGNIKAAPPLRAASRSQMDRARELLKSNDVAAARLIFKRLAETGVADAAFNLAQTYDPDFLKTIPTAGLEPDPALARQWYERAAAMGDPAAATRVSKLDAR